MSEVIKLHKCSICGKQFTDEKYLPFCSKRCADIDLARWFSGSYAVASERMDEQDEESLNEVLNNAKD